MNLCFPGISSSFPGVAPQFEEVQLLVFAVRHMTRLYNYCVTFSKANVKLKSLIF